MSQRKSTRRLLSLTGVIAVAGLGAGLWLANRSDNSATAADAEQLLTTAEITQRDLVIYDETNATLGFTTSVTVSSPVAGTVTAIIEPGDHIAAGTVVAAIDGDPVVALLGDVPSYRDLSTSSSDGIDIRQLEANLVMLGFDPDGDVAIDEEYTTATAAAVTLWEDSIGLDGDGKVTEGEIVYVPGQLLVDTSTASIGAAVETGGALLTARQTERSYLVSATGSSAGAITNIASAGTPVATGTVLFWQAGYPVVAIEGDAATTPALTRKLSASSSNGVDVKLLEGTLVAGGFDPDNTVTVDDDFDDATAAAVTRWWISLGVGADLQDDPVPAGSFVVVPAGLITGFALVADGAAPLGDAVVLGLTTEAREVTTTAPIGDATFALGSTIDVEFPDGSISTGTVVEVGNVATSADNVPGSAPVVTITLRVSDIPASVDEYVQIPVTLRVVSESIPDALVVPVGALLALAEGGYALEVVTTASDGTATTKLVAAEPGLFADGFVSVTGDQLQAGLQVVVPS